MVANELRRRSLELVDFVRLPDGYTNCKNCEYEDGGRCCFHGELPSGDRADLRGLRVYKDTCCAAWDQDGASHIRNPDYEHTANQSRSSMPQIGDVDDFARWVRSQGVSAISSMCPASDLIPVQTEYRQDRVDSIPEYKLKEPIVVSADMRIIDGLHRWIKAGNGVVHVCIVNLPLEKALQLARRYPGAEFVRNYNPDEGRDEHGRWAKVEGVVKEFAKDGVQSALDKLPDPVAHHVENVLNGVVKLAKDSFFVHEAGQKAVEAVVRERGFSEDEARRLRGVLASVDSKTFEVLKVGAVLGVPGTHVPAAVAAALPVASSLYLAYSTAKDPMATLRAAKKAVRVEYRGWHGKSFKPGVEQLHNDSILSDVAGSLERHKFDDGFVACLSCSLDRRGKLDGTALRAAEQAHLGRIPARNEAFTFPSSAAKLDSFRRWLRREIGATGLSDEELWQKYAALGFKKGAARSHQEVRRKQGKLTADGHEEFMQSAMSHPVSVDRVKVLASRSYDEMDGVTSKMAAEMTRTLADGLTQGKSPRQIAVDLRNRVGVAKGRALTIARTEVARAHAEGQLTGFEHLGVSHVGAAVEWLTGGDPCPECASMAGSEFSLEDAHGMLPLHPNCVCAWTPAGFGSTTTNQMKWRKRIRNSFLRVYNYDPDEARDERGRWTKLSKALTKEQTAHYTDAERGRKAELMVEFRKLTDKTSEKYKDVVHEMEVLKRTAKARWEGGREEYPAGLKKTPGVQAVKEVSKDKYIVTLSNGDDHHIHYDRKEAEWMHDNPASSRLDAMLGNSPKYVLQVLVKRQKEGKLNRGEPPAKDVSLDMSLESLKLHMKYEPVEKFHELISRAAVDDGKSQIHGMSDTEEMRRIDVGHISIVFPRTHHGERTAAGTLKELVDVDMHPGLLGSIHRIVHTSQKNKEDGYWSMMYNRAIVSAATGGDGQICVYRGGSASAGTLAHEMGHSLAENEWHMRTRPKAGSDYFNAQKAEPPVTGYGSLDSSEDFAEACRLRTMSRPMFIDDFPKKAKALEEVLEKHAKRNVRGA